MAETTARAWRTVLEHVEGDLIAGRLGPGDRLASERDLAADLGVGRSSVREALRVLEVMGLIRTATGSGPTAGAIITATPGGGLSALLRLQVAAQGFPFDDVVRTRLILETAVVEALAVASPKGGETDAAATADARLIADAMDAPDLTPAEFLALDAQLHLSLAESSGNVVVAAMMAGLRSAIESYVQEGAARIADWPATAARLREEHRGILSAIDDEDPDLASALVRTHIATYYAEAGLAPAPA